MGALRRYHSASRTPLYGLVAGLPLLLLYEGLSALSRASIRNGADVWLVRLLPLPPSVSVWALKLLALGAVGLLLMWRDRTTKIRAHFLGLMVIEATVYSFLLGGLVVFVLRAVALLAFPALGDALSQLTLSLGAGLYEELLFRVLLFGGLSALLSALSGRPGWSVVLGALVSALLFAVAHNVGALGEPFELTRFAYRTLSGLVFTGLYVTRGFGITALTHALYDVWIVLGVT